MDFSFLALSFVFGSLVGSFLNVVVLRYHSGLAFVGRSQCFACGKKLSWSELIPIASFLIQCGRCRSCGCKISFQYPLVEFITGSAFFLIIFKQFSGEALSINGVNLLITHSFFIAVYFWIIASLLIVISIYDFRHKIIPNGLVYSFIALAGLRLVFASLNLLATSPALNFCISKVECWASYKLQATSYLLAGPVLFVPFAILWFLSHGRWMGLGDGKLAWGIGWLLGLSGGIAAILLAFWIGAAASLGIIVFVRLVTFFKKSKLLPHSLDITMKSEVPFGPFLALGAFTALFFDLDFETLFFILSR